MGFEWRGEEGVVREEGWGGTGEEVGCDGGGVGSCHEGRKSGIPRVYKRIEGMSDECSPHV